MTVLDPRVTISYSHLSYFRISILQFTHHIIAVLYNLAYTDLGCRHGVVGVNPCCCQSVTWWKTTVDSQTIETSTPVTQQAGTAHSAEVNIVVYKTITKYHFAKQI